MIYWKHTPFPPNRGAMFFSGRKKEFPSLKAPRPVMSNRNDARSGSGLRRANRRMVSPSAGVSLFFLEFLGWLLILSVGTVQFWRGLVRFSRELFTGVEPSLPDEPPQDHEERREPMIFSLPKEEETQKKIELPQPEPDPTDQAATLRHLYETRKRSPHP